MDIDQLNLGFDILPAGGVFKAKVEQGHEIDRGQAKVLIASLGLFLNGKGGIVETSVFEVFLLGLLQFYDKFLAFFIFTIKVKNHLAVDLGMAKVFSFSVVDFGDFFIRQDSIKKADQNVLFFFQSKKLLEAKISERIEKAGRCMLIW